MVYLAVLFNDWNKLFYDALQDKNEAVFWAQLGRFTWLAFTFIILTVYKFYLTQLLEVRWRAWMTSHYLQRWLDGQVFYRLELMRFQHQPDAGQPATGWSRKPTELGLLARELSSSLGRWGCAGLRFFRSC